MSFLLCFLTAFISFLSTCMMAYIAMAINIAPWVAPVFAVVFMLFLMQIVRQDWFKEHVVIGIAGGSLGGMVGTCLGLTWPSLYFLHGGKFLAWMHSPWRFAGMISALTIAAGSLAFIITHFLREHLIVEHKLKYPMSTLVHEIIYMDRKVRGFIMMANGLAVSSSWNIFTWIARLPLKAYLTYLHSIPVFLSIGFIAGHAIAIPLLVGMLSRIFVLMTLKEKFFYFEKQQTFILTFASGMLFALIFMSVCFFIRAMYDRDGRRKIGESDFMNLVTRFVGDKVYRIALVLSIILCCVVFSWWNIPLMQQLYVLLAMFFLCNVVAMIVGEIGVLDIQSFVSFIILPLTYFSYVQSLPALIIVVFCTICLGVVIDLLFSYKIAHLAKIDHLKILKYQIFGFMVAACSVGFVLWWYISIFKLGSTNLLAQQALSQETFITFGNYNYHVLLLGFLYGVLLFLFCSEMLVVIGGFMMPIYMAFWLIFAGGLSYLVKDPRKYYSFWFGIYASHALWMFMRSILLQV